MKSHDPISHLFVPDVYRYFLETYMRSGVCVSECLLFSYYRVKQFLKTCVLNSARLFSVFCAYCGMHTEKHLCLSLFRANSSLLVESTHSWHLKVKSRSITESFFSDYVSWHFLSRKCQLMYTSPRTVWSHYKNG